MVKNGTSHKIIERVDKGREFSVNTENQKKDWRLEEMQNGIKKL